MNNQIHIPGLSVGHGGMIEGKYQTSGKRWTYKDGTVIYEGEFNRDIKARVMYKLHARGYAYVDLVPEHQDISNMQKVRRANLKHNELKEKGKELFFFEIHANAGGGTGCEVFRAKKSSNATQKLCRIIEQKYKEHFQNLKWRARKRKNWTVVRYTNCPAILLECFFMDNEQDKEMLTTNKGRNSIADWVTDCIIEYINS